MGKSIEKLKDTSLGLTIEELEKFNSTKVDDRVEIIGMEDLVLVHKTRYIPKNGRILTNKEGGKLISKDDYEIKLNGETYKYSKPSFRETLHFTLNGGVTSHELRKF